MRSDYLGVQTWDRGTFLEDEAAAYPGGGMRRRGRAVFPDGRVRAIRAGIADTYFSIPACGRIAGRYVSGFVMMETESGTSIPARAEDRWLAFYPSRASREKFPALFGPPAPKYRPTPAEATCGECGADLWSYVHSAAGALEARAWTTVSPDSDEDPRYGTTGEGLHRHRPAED